jgi:uncharacterized coiled-coil protein SlyX
MSSSASSSGGGGSGALASLSGFVNVGKLEDVIASLVSRMNAQQARIEQLERSAAQSVSIESFSALTARVEHTVEHLNNQFGALDRRLAEMDTELASVADTLATLPALRAAVDGKVDHEVFVRRAEESRSSFAEQLAHLKNDKAGKNVVSSLETSQHRLVEEIQAVQKVLHCKIDRVEVPLLDVASEKLQYLLDFQSTADARLDKAEADVQSLGRAVQTKESRDSAAKTTAALREEIGRKVEAHFVKEQLLAPLHHAEDEIVRLKASEEALDKLMEDYHAHIEKVSREGIRMWAHWAGLAPCAGTPCLRVLSFLQLTCMFCVSAPPSVFVLCSSVRARGERFARRSFRHESSDFRLHFVA